MATKWKKWRNSIGFLAFVFSISLLITGGMDFRHNYQTFGVGSLSEALELAVGGEFQNSRVFREFISGKLLDCLAMGTDDELYNYGYSNGYWYWNDYEYWDAYAYSGDGIDNEANAADVAEQQTEEEGQEEQSQEKSPAERYHEYIQDDKNLLYRIELEQNGQQLVLYTNMDSAIWEKGRLQLPDGYNFYLHFDGEKVEMQKNGAELDVYGDGIYREEEDWYVPGFKNLMGKSEWKNLDVVIMTVSEPAIYYGSRNFYQTGGELYDTRQLYMEQHQQLQYSLGIIAAGLLFFLLYLFRRKDKQIVMNQIAAHTGKLWFECKLLLCFSLPVWMCISGWIGETTREAIAADTSWDAVGDQLDAGYDDNWSTDIAMTEVYEGGTVFSANIIDDFYYLFGYHFGSIVQVLVIFWLFYLFIYDLYKNPRGYKHSLTGKYVSVLNSRSFHQRLAVRIVKRFHPVFALSLAALASVIVFICLWIGGIRELFLAFVVVGILALLFAAEYIYQKKNRQFAGDLEKLANKIANIHEGNYAEAEEFTAEDPDLQHIALELEDIQQGMETAVEERISSERMKVELVANVSHDIKTPLTSIISYIQLLKQEENLPETVRDYIRILDEKSQRLKTMVQDVFSISKAASGQLMVEREEIDFGKLLYQTLADMEEEIAGSPVTVKMDIPEEPVLVVADGGKMYRVFQNLIGNAIKYSLEGSRVHVTLKQDGAFVATSVKNTSSQELNTEIDFAERFTRGDQSRTDGGSGLGLSIAKSFTEACGGTFQLEIIADLFVVTVTFPVSGRERDA